MNNKVLILTLLVIIIGLGYRLHNKRWQKQIIALARVLYKKPQFLILDEATSAMDRNTENFTMNLLQKIKPSCAILFISHRLNRLKNTADMIYILENKTALVSGNHFKLMETNNFYSDYWKEN